jgi:hypothetical protein
VGWHALELSESVQVVPDYEHDHILGLDCWCAPRIDALGLPLVCHRDLAEREGLGSDGWLRAG